MAHPLEAPAPVPPVDLCTAPGKEDFTFGSLLSVMIGQMFVKVDGRAGPSAKYYYECQQCGGTDEDRFHGRPHIHMVNHKKHCLFQKHLPRLHAMANKDVT